MPLPEKMIVLEKLVEELLKENPEEKTVCKFLSDAGIPDNKDPIDRINKVLLALHFETPKKGFQE